MKKKVIKAAEPCETTGCAESAKIAGYCPACYQGNRRLMKQSMAYLNMYIYKVGRLGVRGKSVIAERKAQAKTKAVA